MAKFAVVNSNWVLSSGRWDADFWIKLTEMLQKRGITWDQAHTVKEAIEELHKRGQFPTGTRWYPGKQQKNVVECPSCMSWAVDAVETTVVRTVDGKKLTSFSAAYDCRNCKHCWTKQE